jgi:hypothetical protein
MSYPKLIHEYLDGQLSMVQEDILFAELAKNPDLRLEFNQQVQLQNVALSDMRTISPPTNSTNAIFNSLGFSIPSRDYLNRITPNAATTVPIKQNFIKSFGGFVKKHAVTVAAIFLTAGLTTGIFMLTDNRFAPVEQASKVMFENNVPVITSIEIPQETANNMINNASQSYHSNREGRNITAQAAKQNQIADNDFNTTNPLQQNLNKAASVTKNSSSDNINLAANYSNKPINMIQSEFNDTPIALLNIEPTTIKGDGDNKLIVTYSDQNSNLKVEQPMEKNALSNMNLTYLYKVNDHLFVGLSGGNENFAQRFLWNSKSENLEYQINQAHWYLGGIIRGEYPLHELFQYGDFITPYGQVFFGSTTFGGLLAKLQAGITISPYSQWSFNMGYEFGNYYYKVDKLNNTSKDGFVFGVGLNF